MHPSLRHLDHRPWPLPSQRWTWRQSWNDLAFIHYRVAAEALRKNLPPGIRLQEFDGSAWVGLVPFRMAGVMRRPLPDLPSFSSFPELKLRTYVEVAGKPGVWFFSLDANCWPVVFGGRRFYGLPYFSAAMQQERQGDEYCFSSARRSGAACFRGTYRPRGEVFRARPGSFEFWATERYCLYTANRRGQIARVEVHHAPWPLQVAEVEIEENSVLHAAGIDRAELSRSFLFSSGVDVVSYRQERVDMP